jgi:hypothetical protein
MARHESEMRRQASVLLYGDDGPDCWYCVSGGYIFPLPAAHPVTYLDEFGPDYECGGMAAQAVRWEIWAICKRI